MKKFLISLCFLSLISTTTLADDGFFDDIMADKALKEKTIEQNLKNEGQTTASEILDKAPIKIDIDSSLKPKIRTQKDEQAPFTARQAAPFGLKWLASKDEILYLNVRLTPKQIKDSPNSYIATNLPKPVALFKEVLLSFGDENALWRIAAYGNPIDDDSRASKGVEQYQKFYELLSEKYGNAQQFFTPAAVNVDEVITQEDGVKSKKIKQTFVQIGDEGFKQKLMSGESSLFATFNNQTVGVTLALLADGNGQTFIIINYQNLKAEENKKDEMLDAL
ncbi:MAG: hypothetical protein IJS26_06415 [Alphaproteobacteria bacterium]|nr:hypothetical protein [Alphaproteobacteria bacterium]